MPDDFFLPTSPQVRTAPSATVCQGSIKRAGSNSTLVPRPLQSGHMPWGELKAEHLGRQLGEADAADGQAFSSEKVSISPSDVHIEQPIGQPQCRFHRVGQPRRERRLLDPLRRLVVANPGPGHQPVDHDLDVVLFGLGQLDALRQLDGQPVDPGADIAIGAGLLEDSSWVPLRPRTTGARTWKRVPGGSWAIWSTICWADWAWTSRPHWGQWGCPPGQTGPANNHRSR